MSVPPQTGDLADSASSAYTLADLPLSIFVNCSSPLNGSDPQVRATIGRRTSV